MLLCVSVFDLVYFVVFVKFGITVSVSSIKNYTNSLMRVF